MDATRSEKRTGRGEGVDITPGFVPVSICMFPFVMHSAQW